MWQVASVFAHKSDQRNDAGHLIDKNVFKTSRSFRYQWFRVSTIQANANRPFILSNMKRTTGAGHLENVFGSILGPLLFIIYMNDIHTVSDNLNFILYADDTTLRSPMCSFTRGCTGNIEQISTSINSELNKIADWLAVNKLSLTVKKT